MPPGPRHSWLLGCALGLICSCTHDLTEVPRPEDQGGDAPLADRGPGDQPTADVSASDLPSKDLTTNDAAAPDAPPPDAAAPDAPPPDAAAPDQAPPPPPIKGFCSKDKWCWVNPLPQGDTLYDVWAHGADAVAVGAGGTVLHRAGSTWSSVYPITDRHLYAVWGFSATAVMAVGEKGAVLFRDKVGWSAMNTVTQADLHGVWGAGPKTFYVVGAKGTVLQDSGLGPVKLSPAPSTTATLRGVWVAGPKALFVVGDGGAAFRFDGATWTKLTTCTGKDLYTVWGFSDTNLWVGGELGTVCRLQGTKWSTLSVPTKARVTRIRGPGVNDLYLLDQAGALFHDSGGGFKKVAATAKDTLRGVWPSSGAALAVGEQGAMWHHQNKTWTALSSRFTSAGFSAIWGSSASDIFMVGAGGAVAHHDGKAWAAMTSGTTLDLNAVWGASKAAVYAVGGDGKKPVALRYDGSSWSSFPMPSDKYGYTLHGVWGKNATDVFAVGSQDHPYAGGIMLHLTGKAWQVHTAWKAGSIFTSRYDLWGHGAALYAVGYYSPCIATLANAKWSGGKCENYSVLRGIWGAGPSAIFAVGGSEPALAQRIKHWGGVAWAHHDAKGHALLDVWGASASAVWAVGHRGTVVYKPPAWKPQASGAATDLHGVWGTDPYNVYAVGKGGTILRRYIP